MPVKLGHKLKLQSHPKNVRFGTVCKDEKALTKDQPASAYRALTGTTKNRSSSKLGIAAAVN